MGSYWGVLTGCWHWDQRSTACGRGVYGLGLTSGNQIAPMNFGQVTPHEIVETIKIDNSKGAVCARVQLW